MKINRKTWNGRQYFSYVNYYPKLPTDSMQYLKNPIDLFLKIKKGHFQNLMQYPGALNSQYNLEEKIKNKSRAFTLSYFNTCYKPTGIKAVWY